MAKFATRNLLVDVPDLKTIKDVLFNLDGDAKPHELAMMGGAIVEHGLRLAITRKFVPLTDEQSRHLFSGAQNGTLSSFSDKIRLGHALGLFGDETREDLETIKQIRNTFAHAIQQMNFAHPDVVVDVKRLAVYQKKWHITYTTTAQNWYPYYMSALLFFVSFEGGAITSERTVVLTKGERLP